MILLHGCTVVDWLLVHLLHLLRWHHNGLPLHLLLLHHWLLLHILRLRLSHHLRLPHHLWLTHHRLLPHHWLLPHHGLLPHHWLLLLHHRLLLHHGLLDLGSGLRSSDLYATRVHYIAIGIHCRLARLRSRCECLLLGRHWWLLDV